MVRLWHVAHMTEAVGSTNSVLAGSTLQALHSFNQGFSSALTSKDDYEVVVLGACETDHPCKLCTKQ